MSETKKAKNKAVLAFLSSFASVLNSKFFIYFLSIAGKRKPYSYS